jgi:hypothetical protein
MLCLAACIYSGCSKANDDPETPIIPAPEPELEEEGCPFKLPPSIPYPLADTQWKLVGSLDATTGELTTYRRPKECSDCYTLVFDTDSTATWLNTVQDYKIDGIDIFHLDTCLEYRTNDNLIIDNDPGVTDGRFLNQVMRIVSSYAASPDALLLYYHYHRRINYLLFTRTEL